MKRCHVVVALSDRDWLRSRFKEALLRQKPELKRRKVSDAVLFFELMEFAEDYFRLHGW